MRGLELVIKGNNRSAIRALDEVAARSERTAGQLRRDSKSTTRNFDEMGRGAGRLRGAVSGLAGIVGLGGLAFGIKDVVQAGMGWQQQQAQLQNALRQTGQYSKANLAALNAAASGIAQRGGFAAQENIHALTLFVGATHSVTRAQRDMSLATDISRRTGKDYTTVIRALMMLENGRTTGLARLGIAIPKVRKAQDALRVSQLQYHLKVTPAMREQAAATDALTSKQEAFRNLAQTFGGATSTFSNTTAGRISNLHNRLKELQDRLGAGLLPAVDKLTKVALGLVDLFAKLPLPLKLGILGFVALVPILATMRWSMSLFGSTVRGMGAPFSTLRRWLFGAADDQKVTAGKFVQLADAAILARDALLALATAGGLGGGGSAARAVEGKGGGLIPKLLSKLPGGSKLLGLGAKFGAKALLKFGVISTIVGTLINHVPFLHNAIKHIPVLGGLINGAAGLLGFSHGGIVPRRYGAGGPVGSDTIPGWLTPGEGVVTTAGMRALGADGLRALNSGMGMRPIVLHNTTIVKLPNGRELARAVTQETLNRAARGPSNMVGGGLVTAASGLPA